MKRPSYEKRDENQALAVIRRDGEPIATTLSRFKKKVFNSGILRELKQRECYVKPGEKRKIKHENELRRRRNEEKKKYENSIKGKRRD